MCATDQNKRLRNHQKSEGPLIPFIPEVCIMASVMDNKNEEVSTLAKLISTQSTDADCHFAFGFPGNQTLLSTSIATACLFESHLYMEHHR